MTQRFSGDVVVDIAFHPDKKLNPKSKPGAYYVQVGAVLAQERLDGLTIGLPMRHREHPESPEAIEEIAHTAMKFTLEIRKLPVEYQDGVLVIETRAKEVKLKRSLMSAKMLKKSK